MMNRAKQFTKKSTSARSVAEGARKRKRHSGDQKIKREDRDNQIDPDILVSVEQSYEAASPQDQYETEK